MRGEAGGGRGGGGVRWMVGGGRDGERALCTNMMSSTGDGSYTLTVWVTDNSYTHLQHTRTAVTHCSSFDVN